MIESTFPPYRCRLKIYLELFFVQTLILFNKLFISDVWSSLLFFLPLFLQENNFLIQRGWIKKTKSSTVGKAVLRHGFAERITGLVASFYTITLYISTFSPLFDLLGRITWNWLLLLGLPLNKWLSLFFGFLLINSFFFFFFWVGVRIHDSIWTSVAIELFFIYEAEIWPEAQTSWRRDGHPNKQTSI